MNKDWVRFENIEVDRDGYFITYNPIFTGHNLASMVITFYEPIGVSSAAKVVELEVNYWIKKYPAPLIAIIANETNESLDICSLTGNDYLVGYYRVNGSIAMKWKAVPSSEYSHMQFTKQDLFRIYSDLNHRTSDDAKKEIAVKIRDHKRLKIVLVLWLSVIPALIAFFGWSNPYVSFLALAYSLYIAMRKAAEITGHIKPAEKELQKSKENEAKEHHHYHCQLNPDGFIRLKNENFAKESEAELKQKIQKLQS